MQQLLPLRPVGHDARGRARLLRVHRVRLDLDPRRGGRPPQRDVPFGILASLFVCTLLYIAVSAVITGMVPYPEIDDKAAVASAFRRMGERAGSGLLQASAGLIAAGGLAGMTSVILITFLSQARIFLAMARDGLLPKSIFAVGAPEVQDAAHLDDSDRLSSRSSPRSRRPYFLEEMVNIGTLFAFVVVCGAVLMLRIAAGRPAAVPLPVAVPGRAARHPRQRDHDAVPAGALWERLAYWMGAAAWSCTPASATGIVRSPRHIARRDRRASLELMAGTDCRVPLAQVGSLPASERTNAATTGPEALTVIVVQIDGDAGHGLPVSRSRRAADGRHSLIEEEFAPLRVTEDRSVVSPNGFTPTPEGKVSRNCSRRRGGVPRYAAVDLALGI